MPNWVTFAACLMAKEIHRCFLSCLLPEASVERNAGNLGTSALYGILEWDLLNAHGEGGAYVNFYIEKYCTAHLNYKDNYKDTEANRV